MKCRTCARRLDLEKLDYTVGCKHEQMEGFICLACAFEGVAYWMTNISEDDYCEEYVERISNAFPTHECVKPTHECVDLISRQAALDAISTFGNREYRRKQGTLQDAYKLISALPSAQPERKKGEWGYSDDMYETRVCSVCGFNTEDYKEYNYCPNCGADMRGED